MKFLKKRDFYAEKIMGSKYSKIGIAKFDFPVKLKRT
jgi:hypothetical protein